MHSAKRRRIDTAASTLTKPFRSPRHANPNKSKPALSKRQNGNISCTVPQTTQADSTQLINAKPLSSSPTPTAQHLSAADQQIPSHNASPRVRGAPSSSCLAHSLAHNPLSKQRRSLALQLKNMNAALNTVDQALKIIRTKQADDVNSSLNHWRNIARDVADHLFQTTKDHIDHTGGLSTHQEIQTPLNQPSQWPDDLDLDTDKLTPDQKEQLEFAQEEARLEAEKYGLLEPDKPPDDQVQVDKSLTMETMLRQLNIDLDLIGYDVQEEQWID